MATPTPFTLTPATRFQPRTARPRSRSPSRSPLRKSQFAARELDPLLSNLSPDSTLKALQTTATITSGGSGQDALAKSIAEATPAEREIGIRAAVAAQKLREWYQEVSRWPWPTRRDRGWGAGFLPPPKSNAVSPAPADLPHLGFLPTTRIYEYEERIEDIRDGVEALELEDVKDHVFSAHVPERSVSVPVMLDQSSGTRPTGYGRMRDFTALITATIIQALPQLANLTLLLDTWEIRLSVLRQIPEITQIFRSTQAGIQTAFQVVRNPETGPLVTMEEYDITKPILGGKVASLGSRIDKLLDMLEGQEDSLPKSWIDMLENIETQYAAWAVEAEHVAIRNGLLSKALAEQSETVHGQEQNVLDINQNSNDRLQPVVQVRDNLQKLGDPTDASPLAELPSGDYFSRPSPSQKSIRKFDASNKLPLNVSTNNTRHNRGVSEVSFAGSTFSAMSDISAAEIVDAKSTKVLASPKISVVDNPFRASRDELSWFSKPNPTAAKEVRPPMLQRASTASIEVVSRNLVKQVTLTRSRSHDMLSDGPSPTLERPGTPSQALQQLVGSSSRHSPPLEDFHLAQPVPKDIDGLISASKSPTISPSPSLRVEPLQIKGKETKSPVGRSPDLPRRSSKRLSQILDVESNSQTPTGPAQSYEESSSSSADTLPLQNHDVVRPNQSLEAKIEGILSTIPTRIRLAKDYEHDETHTSSSTSSTRSSTPAPSLTLSPVKGDRTSRQAASGDVRMYHLTRSGQARDAPPVKLFVRAVGEHGERVMVRVGGGWADLAEYLREYSLHHGHRGLVSDSLEVANFPSPQSGQKDVSKATGLSTPISHSRDNSMTMHDIAKHRSSPTGIGRAADAPELVVVKTRKSEHNKTTDRTSVAYGNGWNPPPVPPIPKTYSMSSVSSPTMTTSTSNGITTTTMMQPFNPNSSRTSLRAASNPVYMSQSSDGRVQSSTFITSGSSPGGTKYTPLGAGGPKSYVRRNEVNNASHISNRESWVEGMVGKARAVSGSSTVVYGPTTTTTTTVVSRSRPLSRRVSALANLSGTNISTEKTMSTNADTSSSVSPESSSPGVLSPSSVTPAELVPVRSKSRLSFGDVGGIRRVFLRRKSDKGLT